MVELIVESVGCCLVGRIVWKINDPMECGPARNSVLTIAVTIGVLGNVASEPTEYLAMTLRVLERIPLSYLPRLQTVIGVVDQVGADPLLPASLCAASSVKADPECDGGYDTPVRFTLVRPRLR